MADTLGEGEKVYEVLKKACDSFLGYRPTFAGAVRRDKAVREAIRAQTPLLSHAPDSRAAQDVTKIAWGLGISG